jgi:hypothetical protein
VSGWLYRCYNAGWHLLYIGKTTRPPGAREVEHERYTAWWGEVATVEYEAVDGWLDGAEQAAIAAEHPEYNIQYRRDPACYWCNDVQVIVGPGYALVRCPACNGGAWWPPFPAPLHPAERLYPEVELSPKPCGYLGRGYVAPTERRPTGLGHLNIPPEWKEINERMDRLEAERLATGLTRPATLNRGSNRDSQAGVVDGREVPPPGLPRQALAFGDPTGKGLDPSGRSSVPLTLSPLPGEEHPPDDHQPEEGQP